MNLFLLVGLDAKIVGSGAALLPLRSPTAATTIACTVVSDLSTAEIFRFVLNVE